MRWGFMHARIGPRQGIAQLDAVDIELPGAVPRAAAGEIAQGLEVFAFGVVELTEEAFGRQHGDEHVFKLV